MATTLFPLDTRATTHLGTNLARANGATTDGWDPATMKTTRGSGLVAAVGDTVTGPTNGIEIGSTFGIEARSWISDPVSADVTISGTIQFNFWMSENSMSANVGAQCIIEVIRAIDNSIVTIINNEKLLELPTTRAAQTWTGNPPAGVLVNKGDRLRMRVLGNDVGTMVSGFTFDFSFQGATGAADGDSFITFTETFSFMTTAPSGSNLFLTDTASDVTGALIEREMWTSRGAGVQTDVTNTTAGWTAPIQMTDTAGGTAVEWFSKPLQAFTLTGLTKAFLRVKSSVASPTSLKAELARVNGDGSSASVWSTWCLSPLDAPTGGGDGVISGSAETGETVYLSGDDLAFTDGQRLRLRVFIDDASNDPLITGRDVTLWYAGTSGGASGDSFITLEQTVSEFVSATKGFPFKPNMPYHLLRR